MRARARRRGVGCAVTREVRREGGEMGKVWGVVKIWRRDWGDQRAVGLEGGTGPDERGGREG